LVAGVGRSWNEVDGGHFGVLPVPRFHELLTANPDHPTNDHRPAMGERWRVPLVFS